MANFAIVAYAREIAPELLLPDKHAEVKSGQDFQF